MLLPRRHNDFHPEFIRPFQVLLEFLDTRIPGGAATFVAQKDALRAGRDLLAVTAKPP
jgi:hypothetical protein